MKNYFLWPSSQRIDEENDVDIWENIDEMVLKIERCVQSTLFPSYTAVLFPSCRSAIYSICESMGLKRKDYVGISEYSSHCVIDAIGRLAMPECTFSSKLQCVLVNHQWGYRRLLSNDFHTKVIEDSCDSIITDEKQLFKNNSGYEVFSLPKILGTSFGGIVVCREREAANALKKIRDSRDLSISKMQYGLKNKYIRTQKNNYLAYYSAVEAVNGFLPISALLQVKKYYSMFFNIAEQRKVRVKNFFQYIKKELICSNTYIENGRLPTVIPIRYDYRIAESFKRNGFEMYVRNFNDAQFVDQSNFIQCIPVPIHQDVTDDDFNKMLEILIH